VFENLALKIKGEIRVQSGFSGQKKKERFCEMKKVGGGNARFSKKGQTTM